MKPSKIVSIQLKSWADFAGNVLAIVGLLTLAFWPIKWLYSKITLNDANVIARPICERYLFQENQPQAGVMRLLGVQLITLRSAMGVRVRFTNLITVTAWRMQSDGLSIEEQARFLAQLPTGSLSTVVTPELPTLSNPSSTTIQALATLAGDDSCGEADWVTVTSNSGIVYQTDPSIGPIRGLSFQLDPFLTLVLALGITAAIVAIRYRRRRRLAA